MSTAIVTQNNQNKILRSEAQGWVSAIQSPLEGRISRFSSIALDYLGISVDWAHLVLHYLSDACTHFKKKLETDTGQRPEGPSLSKMTPQEILTWYYELPALRYYSGAILPSDMEDEGGISQPVKRFSLLFKDHFTDKEVIVPGLGFRFAYPNQTSEDVSPSNVHFGTCAIVPIKLTVIIKSTAFCVIQVKWGNKSIEIQTPFIRPTWESFAELLETKIPHRHISKLALPDNCEVSLASSLTFMDQRHSNMGFDWMNNDWVKGVQQALEKRLRGETDPQPSHFVSKGFTFELLLPNGTALYSDKIQFLPLIPIGTIDHKRANHRQDAEQWVSGIKSALSAMIPNPDAQELVCGYLAISPSVAHAILHYMSEIGKQLEENSEMTSQQILYWFYGLSRLQNWSGAVPLIDMVDEFGKILFVRSVLIRVGNSIAPAIAWIEGDERQVIQWRLSTSSITRSTPSLKPKPLKSRGLSWRPMIPTNRLPSLSNPTIMLKFSGLTTHSIAPIRISGLNTPSKQGFRQLDLTSTTRLVELREKMDSEWMNLIATEVKLLRDPQLRVRSLEGGPYVTNRRHYINTDFGDAPWRDTAKRAINEGVSSSLLESEEFLFQFYDPYDKQSINSLKISII